MKEFQEMPGLLPLHRDAAIFVRHDKNRPDVIRALITGNVPLLRALNDEAHPARPMRKGAFCSISSAQTTTLMSLPL